MQIPEIEERLAAFDPHAEPPGPYTRAAVAMLLREMPSGLEVLFIERARHPADPWSGHMAFPGGRVDPGDADPRAAAERETLEEVGISLEGSRALGELGDLRGRDKRPSGIVISGFVYQVPPESEPVPNYEVASSFWFPLAGLLEPTRHVKRQFPEAGSMQFPGVLVGDPDRHVVWGLTHRFLQVFFEAQERSFPPEG